VDRRRTCCCESLSGEYRIVTIIARTISLSLSQTNAAAVLQVDSWNDLHTQFLISTDITSSKTNPLVATALPPSIVRLPLKSVNVPPASWIIGDNAAQSQMFITGSSITSARPVATMT